MRFGACELKLAVLDCIHRNVGMYATTVRVEDIASELNISDRKIEEICKFLTKKGFLVEGYSWINSAYPLYSISATPPY